MTVIYIRTKVRASAPVMLLISKLATTL